MLAAGLLACSQEQPEEKKPETEKKSSLMSLFKERQQNAGAAAVNSEPNALSERRSRLPPGLDRLKPGISLLEDHRGRRGPQPGQKQLSQEEIRENQEKAAQAREKKLAEARININSKDDALRLQAVSHLDTDNANDLKSLEKALASDSNTEIREEAAVQLSDGDRKVAEPALIKALNDPAPEVVVSAIESLAMREGKDKSAIVDAIKQISSAHPDEDVREAAQSALEELE